MLQGARLLRIGRSELVPFTFGAGDGHKAVRCGSCEMLGRFAEGYESVG